MAVALVGRGTEQAELTSTWLAARSGQARVVGLAGPAGIGKTALVGQFLRDAAPARPVWVSGAPEERTLSWGVLGQAVPALGPALRPGPPPVWAAPDPEADPLYIGQSFLDDVRAAGETILVLDDAHWADRQSQAALRFAARHMTGLPVLVIVIHNDEVPLDESWRRLFGSAHGSLVTLAGLTPEELVRLAVARGHFGLSPAAAARLHEHTGGNPLYASALLAQLPARDLAAGALPAPRSIVETVAANLAGRSEPAVALLSAAAVLGRSFDVAQASALAGSLAGPLAGTGAAGLDEAVAAGLAEEVPGTAGRRFAFSHALVHQAVYTRIALARRRELHRQAGTLLGEAEALRHRVAAADGPDPELAADLDRQAALDTVRGELAAASSRLQDALRLTPPGPARAPRLLAVVEAELIAGDTVAASQHAAELAAGGGDPWWDYVAGYQSLLAGRVDDARLRLGRALDATAAGSPGPRSGASRGSGASGGSGASRGPADLRARIAAQLAILAVVSLSYPEMEEYGQIAVLAESSDPRVQAFAWFARTLGMGLAGRGAQALADLGARGLSPGLEPLVARGVVELWTDDLDGACRHLGEAVNRAYRGEPLRVSQALAFLGDAEYRRGQLADSVLHTELAVGDAEENERFWDYALLHGLACQTRAARGDWAQADAHAAAAARWAPLIGTRSGLFSAAVARAAIAQAQPDAAALLAAARDMEDTFDPAEPGIILLGPLRAEALVQLGRPSEADDALTAFGARFAGTGRKSARLGIARARGRIAAARGAPADALASYAEALELAADVGLPLEEGRVELLMAQCLAACGRYDPAGVRLRAAGRRFARIGASAYLAQAVGLAGRLGLALDDPPGQLTGLTGAERRVAQLARGDLSNEEIARQLSIQRGSVEFHLTSIYRKLGVTGRPALRRLLREPE
jgi:DNA-binding CsgD family transcriptional regulator